MQSIRVVPRAFRPLQDERLFLFFEINEKVQKTKIIGVALWKR
jgi:hypothetical protein